MSEPSKQDFLKRYAKLKEDADLYERIFQILGKQEYRDTRNRLLVTMHQMEDTHPWIAKEYAKCVTE